MPVHLRTDPGAYADAVLCPGDPRRAEYIANTFFDAPELVNEERGMLGFTGTFEGQRISVQSTGMGCPSAAIVFEELVQLGAKRLLRIGTCGGLAEGLAMGDLIVAITAVPADSTAMRYVGGEAHVPTADFALVHAAVHAAKHADLRVRVGPVATSDTFYDPDPERATRWASRGVLGVEMEAAVLFTIGALRRVSAGALLVVSDVMHGGQFVRISDEELRAAVDRMTELAIRTVLADGSAAA
jgi:5'-methylthioadenosine phosphorylase/purine-nucleoside phosphorylase